MKIVEVVRWQTRRQSACDCTGHGAGTRDGGEVPGRRGYVGVERDGSATCGGPGRRPGTGRLGGAIAAAVGRTGAPRAGATCRTHPRVSPAGRAPATDARAGAARRGRRAVLVPDAAALRPSERLRSSLRGAGCVLSNQGLAPPLARPRPHVRVRALPSSKGLQARRSPPQ
jgi:hypothetical protein